MTLKKCAVVFVLMTNGTEFSFASDDSKNTGDWIPKKVVSTLYHTCVLSTKGQVKCWGYNESGELGIATDSRPGRAPETMGSRLPTVNFGTGLNAKDICAGTQFTCVATTTGQVKCWGVNSFGQLGQERSDPTVGLTKDSMGDHLPFTNLGSDFHAKKVYCGDRTSCALSEPGKLKCWGLGENGELGPNISPKRALGRVKGDMGDTLPYVALPAPISYVSIGGGTSCAASKSDVYCWGNNDKGQAGLGSSARAVYLPGSLTATIPVKLEDEGVATVIEGISAGYQHTCAIYRLTGPDHQQKIKCWGFNFGGTLGNGATGIIGRTPETMGSKLPETQLALNNIVQLHAHDNYSCALAQNGTVKCWGANGGSLGLGNDMPRGSKIDDMGTHLAPVDLSLPAIALSSGAVADSTCAILINHEIKCWGYGFYGSLGYEDLESRGANPQDMGENLPFVRFK